MTKETDMSEDNERITDLKIDMRDGFKQVNDKLDKLVSRGEFEAHVQRLDGRLDGIEKTNEAQDKRLQSAMASVSRTAWKISGLAATGISIAIAVIGLIFR